MTIRPALIRREILGRKLVEQKAATFLRRWPGFAEYLDETVWPGVEERIKTLHCLRQVRDGIGFAFSKPLQDVGINAFYQAMEVIPLTRERQQAMPFDDGSFLDQMTMRSRSGRIIVLFNLVRDEDREFGLDTDEPDW